MINQTKAIKRTPSAQKAGAGIKMLIMAASLATTIGGWGILALNQTQDAMTAAQETPATTQPVSQPATSTFAQSNTRSTTNSNNNSTTTLRQVNPSTVAPRAVARTRSSR